MLTRAFDCSFRSAKFSFFFLLLLRLFEFFCSFIYSHFFVFLVFLARSSSLTFSLVLYFHFALRFLLLLLNCKQSRHLEAFEQQTDTSNRWRRDAVNSKTEFICLLFDNIFSFIFLFSCCCLVLALYSLQ